jgi:general secretion pathway protein A
MYTDYFGFREKPFSITPDPRFFYTNPSYQEAYASLVYGILERRGFIVLTGEIGTGKTTLLRRLMENMEPHIRFIFFYDTMLAFEEILDFICHELGLPTKDRERLHKIRGLNQFLIHQLTKREIVVLLIDEAQNLEEEALENLRLLSNLETSAEKLLQIVLVGQPELQTKLNQPTLRQLKQRIAIQGRLERLDDEEVGPYIYYRLSVVGYKRQQLFAPDAIQEIAYYSNGFPRLINILCDNALLIAYATSQKRITSDIVREAANDLRLEGQRSDLLITEEAEKLSHEFGIAKRPSDPRLGRASYHGRPSGTTRSGLRIVMAGLLLGVGGIGLYTWRGHAGFLGDVGERLRALPYALHSTIDGWNADPGSGEARPQSYREATSRDPSTAFIEKVGQGSAPDLRATDPPMKSQGNQIASEQIKVTAGGTTAATGGQDTAEPGSAATVPETAGWREKPITVQPGSTVAEIAGNIYGSQRNLGLDLIKEYNTHIENLNRIFAGQRLWLPPLSRETLVRQQADGTFNLILASFRNPQQSAQLAQIARLKGYDIAVSPRRVSDDLMLYRVEISGLGDTDAVNQAWEIASVSQWITFAENSSGQRF